MLYTIDRFENEWAVLIDDSGNTHNVDSSVLPEGVKEGTVVEFDGAEYRVDQNETDARREKAKKLIQSLFQ